jgi:hypothetical protein
MPTRHRAGLALGILNRDDIGRCAAEQLFHIGGLHHSESQPHLAQEVFAARGRTGEDDLEFV